MANELHEACKAGDLVKVQNLLAKNKDCLNQLHTEHETYAIFFAAQCEFNDIVEYLLSAGAETSDPKGGYKNLLYWACYPLNRHTDALTTLSKNPSFNNGTNIAHVMAALGHEKYFFTFNSISKLVSSSNDNGFIPFFYAFLAEKYNFIKKAHEKFHVKLTRHSLREKVKLLGDRNDYYEILAQYHIVKYYRHLKDNEAALLALGELSNLCEHYLKNHDDKSCIEIRQTLDNTYRDVIFLCTAEIENEDQHYDMYLGYKNAIPILTKFDETSLDSFIFKDEILSCYTDAAQHLLHHCLKKTSPEKKIDQDSEEDSSDVSPHILDKEEKFTETISLYRKAFEFIPKCSDKKVPNCFKAQVALDLAWAYYASARFYLEENFVAGSKITEQFELALTELNKFAWIDNGLLTYCQEIVWSADKVLYSIGITKRIGEEQEVKYYESKGLVAQKLMSARVLELHGDCQQMLHQPGVVASYSKSLSFYLESWSERTFSSEHLQKLLTKLLDYFPAGCSEYVLFDSCNKILSTHKIEIIDNLAHWIRKLTPLNPRFNAIVLYTKFLEMLLRQNNGFDDPFPTMDSENNFQKVLRDNTFLREKIYKVILELKAKPSIDANDLHARYRSLVRQAKVLKGLIPDSNDPPKRAAAEQNLETRREGKYLRTSH